MENKYLLAAIVVASLIIGAGLGQHFGASNGLNVNCTNGGATASGSGGLGGSGGVGGAGSQAGGGLLYGASSGTQSSTLPGSFTAATTTVVSNSPGIVVNPDIHQLGVNTSTNLTANATVVSGVATVSSTLQLGSAFEGSTRRGQLCFWNGTNFTKFWIEGNGAGTVGGFTTSTSATCP